MNVSAHKQLHGPVQLILNRKVKESYWKVKEKLNKLSGFRASQPSGVEFQRLHHSREHSRIVILFFHVHPTRGR